MNTRLLPLAVLLYSGAGCTITKVRAQADPLQARAFYQNLSSEQVATQQKNPGVMAIMGHRGPLTSNPLGGGGGESIVLQESSFGQPLSTWYPSPAYASGVITAATAVLYPDAGQLSTRAGIQGSRKPFRYKWLLFTGTTDEDVTAFDPTTIAGWFTDEDRAVIYAQIDLLKAAVANSPLDTSLRDMLLDVFYDLAVAEMQAVKPRLAQLAGVRLGLVGVPAGKFVIDEEIKAYEEITKSVNKAVEQYAKLLKDPFPGIDPGMFDTRPGASGMPMGRYIFIKQQPHRNSTRSAFANDSGVHGVPELDDPDGRGGQPGSVVPRPANEKLFDGYKDLKVIWDIMGQSLLHEVSLARLRGTRQAPGDLALARQALIDAHKRTSADLQVIRNWFPELFPPNLNALSPSERLAVNLRLQSSGVLASQAVIDNGHNEILGAAAFLNGTANLLGFDPEFLLLVQDQTGTGKESYDTLRDMLTGATKPLTVAKDEYNAARAEYQGFQEKVDRVAADIESSDLALADRFRVITGFAADDTPGFDFVTLNAKPGSELDRVKLTIASLNAQASLRNDLVLEINNLTRDEAGDAKDGYAVQVVNSALQKEQALLAAGQRYKNTTVSPYREKIGMAAGAAAAQAAYDSAATAAGIIGNIDLVDMGTAAAVSIPIAVAAGALNMAMQTSAAAVIGLREMEIDYASIDFSVTTETVDAALTVNQARQELNSLKREQIATNIAARADEGALAQAVAERTALLAELGRIQKNRDLNVSLIRKKSYASPLHYQRAEASQIEADAAFRTAQRWVFYTLQALEYKWHGRFATSDASGRSWDASTVFKVRNAKELEDLVIQMNLWDATRVTQTTNSALLLTRISLLEHMLARNPNRSQSTPGDPGVRMEGSGATATAVPTLQYFRNRLNELRDASGNLIIPLNTAIGSQLIDQIDGNFFIGATYNTDNSIAPGFWREKIQYVKVNVIGDDAPASPRSYAGNLTYGGTTYFRTRIPPCANRLVAGTGPEDQPGDMMATPFRFWVSPDFSQNFVPVSEHTVSIPVAYGQSTALLPGSGNDLLSPSYQINAFAGRSIAATGWKLRINRTQSGGLQVDPAHIKDIEIIIAYRHSDRLAPNCP